MQMLSATSATVCIPPALPGTLLSSSHSPALASLVRLSPRLCVTTSTGEAYLGLDPDHEAVTGASRLTPALGRRLSRYCPLDLSMSRGTRGPRWRVVSAAIGPRIAVCVTAGGQVVAVPVTAIDGVSDTAAAAVAKSLQRRQQDSLQSVGAASRGGVSISIPNTVASSPGSSRPQSGAPRGAGTMVLVHGVSDGFVKQVQLAVPRPHRPADSATPAAVDAGPTLSDLANALAPPRLETASTPPSCHLVPRSCWFVLLLADGTLSAFSEQPSRVSVSRPAVPAGAGRPVTAARGSQQQARAYQTRYTTTALPRGRQQGRIVSYACSAGAVWGVDHAGTLWRWGVPLSTFSAGWTAPHRALVVAQMPGGGRRRAAPAPSRPRVPSSVPSLQGGVEAWGAGAASAAAEAHRSAFAHGVSRSGSGVSDPFVPSELAGDPFRTSQALEAVFAAPNAAWSFDKQQRAATPESSDNADQEGVDPYADGLVLLKKRPRGRGQLLVAVIGSALAPVRLRNESPPRTQHVEGDVWMLGAPSSEAAAGDSRSAAPRGEGAGGEDLLAQVSKASSLGDDWDLVPDADTTPAGGESPASGAPASGGSAATPAAEADVPARAAPSAPLPTLAVMGTTLDASSATTRFRVAAAGWGCVAAVTQCGEAWVWDWPEPVPRDGGQSLSAHDVMAAAIEASTGQALQPIDGCRFDGAAVLPPAGGVALPTERGPDAAGADAAADTPISPSPGRTLSASTPVPLFAGRLDCSSDAAEVATSRAARASRCPRLMLMQRPRSVGMSDEEMISGAGAEGAGIGLATAASDANDALADEHADATFGNADMSPTEAAAAASSAPHTDATGRPRKPRNGALAAASSAAAAGPTPVEADAQWARFVRAVRKLVHDRGTAWLAAERALINEMRRKAAAGADVALVRPRPPDLWTLITEDEAARLLSDARKRMLNAPLTQRRRQQVWPLLLRLQGRILQCSRAAIGMDEGREGEADGTDGYGGDIDLRPHVVAALLEEASEAVKHAHTARRARSGDTEVRPEEEALQVLWRTSKGAGSPVRSSRAVSGNSGTEDAGNGLGTHILRGGAPGDGGSGRTPNHSGEPAPTAARRRPGAESEDGGAGWSSGAGKLPAVARDPGAAGDEPGGASAALPWPAPASTAGGAAGGRGSSGLDVIDGGGLGTPESAPNAADDSDGDESAGELLAAAEGSRIAAASAGEAAPQVNSGDGAAIARGSGIADDSSAPAARATGKDDAEAGYTDNFAADAAKIVRAARQRRRSSGTHSGPRSGPATGAALLTAQDETELLSEPGGVSTVLLRSLTAGNLFAGAGSISPPAVSTSISAAAASSAGEPVRVERSVSNRSDALAPGGNDDGAPEMAAVAVAADSGSATSNSAPDEAGAVNQAAIEAKRAKARKTLYRSLGVLASDMVRTFPATGLFHCPGTPLFERVKQAVLAHTLWDERTGYIQGLTYLAAVLALHAGPDPADDFAARAEALVLGSGMEMVDAATDDADRYAGGAGVSVVPSSPAAAGRAKPRAAVAPAGARGLAAAPSSHGVRAVPRQDAATAVTFRMLAILTRQPMLLRLLRVEAAAIGSYSEAMDTALGHSDSALATRLRDASITADLFLYGWAQPLLVRSLPLRSVVRIWDGFLCYGTHFMFIAALLVLRLLRPVLMRSNDDDCMAIVTGGCLSSGVAGRAWSAITDEALAEALKKPAIQDRTVVHLSELEVHMPRVIPTIPKTARLRQRTRIVAAATLGDGQPLDGAASHKVDGDSSSLAAASMTAAQQAQAGVLGGLL